MASTFGARMKELDRIVGHGNLIIKIVVDQIYAKYQHESLDLKHPRGGGGKFVTRTLFTEYRGIYRGLARDALRPRGLVSAATVGAEKLSKGVYKNAPHEFNDLRNSGHPTVKDAGRIVYDRPPVVKRLTQSQLKAKDRARGRR